MTEKVKPQNQMKKQTFNVCKNVIKERKKYERKMGSSQIEPNLARTVRCHKCQNYQKNMWKNNKCQKYHKNMWKNNLHLIRRVAESPHLLDCHHLKELPP